MTKTWLANVGLILLVVFAIFLVGYSAGNSLNGLAPAGSNVCGDGVLLRNVEQCDDGNRVDGDGCDKTCRIERGRRAPSICGNGVRELGEECDDGNKINDDGCSERCLSETTTWQCDDLDNREGNEGEETTNIWIASRVHTRRSSAERWALRDMLIDGARTSPVDICLNSNTLREFYCSRFDNRPINSDVICENGCSRGACSSPSCADSDGGDISIAGTVTGIYRGTSTGMGVPPDRLGINPSVQEIQTYEDGCYGERVREFTCSVTGFVDINLRNCPSGQLCTEGRCTAPPPLPESPPPPSPPPEICNGLDDDNDRIIDEGCDDDNDGSCDASMEFVSATCGSGIFSFNSNCCWRGGDCNDNHNRIGMLWESCYDSLDNDCNGIVNDGCFETRCDDLDSNGNGLVDEGCDRDGDGYCSRYLTIVGTPAVCPNGGGDCSDGVASINPGAPENCFDEFNNNCDLRFNEGCGPFTCVDFDGFVRLTSSGGNSTNPNTSVQSHDFANICVGNNAINQTSCRDLGGAVWATDNYNYYILNSLVSCPSGTRCSDSDGPEEPIPAVCS